MMTPLSANEALYQKMRRTTIQRLSRAPPLSLRDTEVVSDVPSTSVADRFGSAYNLPLGALV